MSFLSNITKGVIAGALATVVSVSAYAAPILTASIVPNPTASNLPFSLLSLGTAPGAGAVSQNFANLPIAPGITATATGNSGIYVGDQNGVTRSPYRAANGTATNEQYFNAQANSGSVVLNFTTGQSFLNLLWGSVDLNSPVNYNLLSITFSGGGSNFTVNGGQIVTEANPGVTPGTTNVAVQISNLDPFTTATFTATSQAFEFALGGPTVVPEPASLALFGAGLLGLGLARRARRKAV